MSDVQRYKLTYAGSGNNWGLVTDANGEYVHFGDYDALARQIAEAEKAAKLWESDVDLMGQLKRAQQRIEQLEAVLAAVTERT